MMDYIQESAIWNPYENKQQLVKWIATYYSTQKDEGKTRKSNKREGRKELKR